MKTRKVIEIKNDCTAVTNFNAEIKANKKSRDYIDKKTKDFLSGGGKIDELPNNFSNVDVSGNMQKRFNTGVMI